MSHKIHKLKIFSYYFQSVMSGIKTFEVRFDDRSYKVGDLIEFIPYDPVSRSVDDRLLCQNLFQITYILYNYGLKPGFVVLSIKRLYDFLEEA